jgi:hypothetical protein
MLAVALECDRQFDSDIGLALDEYLRFGTRRPSWPAWARLESWRAVGGASVEVDFVRRAAAEAVFGLFSAR